MPQVGDSVAGELKRSAAKSVSLMQKKHLTPGGLATGKFGGLPKGPSGGSMNGGGKKRSSRWG